MEEEIPSVTELNVNKFCDEETFFVETFFHKDATCSKIPVTLFYISKC